VVLLLTLGCGAYDLFQIVVEPDPEADPEPDPTVDTVDDTGVGLRSRARCEAGVEAACDCLEAKYATSVCIRAYVEQNIEACVNRDPYADWVDCMADFADAIETQLLASPYGVPAACYEANSFCFPQGGTP